MIEGLADLFEEDGGGGDRAALERALGELFPGRSKLIGRHAFQPNVHRLTIGSRGVERTVVVKRLAHDRAVRNELAFSTWLPAIGLQGACAALLACAAAPDGKSLWHVYEDVGDGALARGSPDRDRVAAVAQLVARLHSRFADHPLLRAARLLGGDLGVPFFATNVAAALHRVRARLSRREDLGTERRALLERHAARLEELSATLPMRSEAFRAHAGPETLLHGDLWTTNTFAADGGRRACLIDWDHAGAGPASYDVSTFLLRFPREHRGWVLEQYRAGTEERGWRVPGVPELNVLFETAEVARYACCLGGLALSEREPEWVWERLEEIDRWFRVLEPVMAERGESGGPRR